MRVALPDVTLCAADCVHPALAARALDESMRRCDFADAILFSDRPASGPFRGVRIATLESRVAYSEFVLKRLVEHVTTSHFLIVQWDGYVVSADAWTEDFLQYDYIGAVWPWYADDMQVGNGGFSLRSSRLLQLTAAPEFRLIGNAAEDELIGRVHRPWLQVRRGIRIAPTYLAHRFSYERAAPVATTFGFHGLFNMGRHLDDASMLWVAHQLDHNVLRSREYFELLASYVGSGQQLQAVQLYARMRNEVGLEHLVELARTEPSAAAGVLQLTRLCEQWTNDQVVLSQPREIAACIPQQ